MSLRTKMKKNIRKATTKNLVVQVLADFPRKVRLFRLVEIIQRIDDQLALAVIKSDRGEVCFAGLAYSGKQRRVVFVVEGKSISEAIHDYAQDMKNLTGFVDIKPEVAAKYGVILSDEVVQQQVEGE